MPDPQQQSGVPAGWEVVGTPSAPSSPSPSSAGYWEDKGIAGKVWHPANGAKEGNRIDNQVAGMPPELAVISGLSLARAMAAPGLTAAGRAVAGAKNVVGQGVAALKYEATKTMLERMGVPPLIAATIAMAVARHRGGGAAAEAEAAPKPTAPAAPTVPANATGTSWTPAAMPPQRPVAPAPATAPVAPPDVGPVKVVERVPQQGYAIPAPPAPVAPPPQTMVNLSPATAAAVAPPPGTAPVAPAAPAPVAPPSAPPPAAASQLASRLPGALTDEEVRAVEGLMAGGVSKEDALAALAHYKANLPASAPTPAAPASPPTPAPSSAPPVADSAALAAAKREVERLMTTGKTYRQALNLVQKQLEMASRLGATSEDAMLRAIQRRIATGRWD